MVVANKQTGKRYEMTDQEWADVGLRQKLFRIVQPTDNAPQTLQNKVSKTSTMNDFLNSGPTPKAEVKDNEKKPEPAKTDNK